ncbi:recombinase family protein [Amycolatopsis aidingensis]|uniref:recombinase family protein n=1 Tax=Amycolatopsis aidingensis TaxID=2842453 RepID=UPI001C0E04A9|nr:recombinase family protein [Amycolatopsis aidingensis]
MTTTSDPSTRPHRAARRDDPALYPSVRTRTSTQTPPGWFRRLREAVANYLAARYETGARRDTLDDGIRTYHDELAWRARAVLQERTREGWWLRHAPYGYTLEHHWIDEESGRAGWRHRLAVDQVRAPIVPLIFSWHLHEKLGERAILRRLIEQQHPQPLDPISGRPRAWSLGAVRTILNNPAYLGYVVRDRTLRGQHRPPERWTWSTRPCHRQLVDPAVFWAVYNSRFPGVTAHPTAEHTQRQDHDREAA